MVDTSVYDRAGVLIEVDDKVVNFEDSKTYEVVGVWHMRVLCRDDADYERLVCFSPEKLKVLEAYDEEEEAYEYEEEEEEIWTTPDSESLTVALLKIKDEMLQEIMRLFADNGNTNSIGGNMHSTMNKTVAKLNGVKKDSKLELTQEASQKERISVSLYGILKDSEVIKSLGLGKEALLQGLTLNGDSLELEISKGKVTAE